MWLIPSLDYISFRKLKFTQPPSFHTAVCILIWVFVTSCVLMVPGDSNSIRNALYKAVCQYTMRNTVLSLWILLSGYTVQTCSCLSFKPFSSVKAYNLSFIFLTHPDHEFLLSSWWHSALQESQANPGVLVPLTYDSSDHFAHQQQPHLHTSCILWTVYAVLWTALHLTALVFSNMLLLQHIKMNPLRTGWQLWGTLTTHSKYLLLIISTPKTNTSETVGALYFLVSNSWCSFTADIM